VPLRQRFPLIQLENCANFGGMGHRGTFTRRKAFTLIEMSIVLIIVGLIVGGILVGQDLMNAAAVRATIAQVDKFNSAVHTFQNKYGGLPGDINGTLASQFGFQARGQYAGEGDGNGIIEGIANNTPAVNNSLDQGAGETVVFWVDLSTANLIDGTFNTASPTVVPSSAISGSTLNSYLPVAKVRGGNYVYVWSGGYSYYAHSSEGDNANYFGIAAISSIAPNGHVTSIPGLSAQQAYALDKKIDDGLPQSGSVVALYDNATLAGSLFPSWAGGSSAAGASTGANGPTTSATNQSSTTCYDNGGGSGVMQYSLGTTTSNGTNLNCALSFKFQ
jgi:prepilin-type N-terminal cleavage/methylation domain-containing protein